MRHILKDDKDIDPTPLDEDDEIIINHTMKGNCVKCHDPIPFLDIVYKMSILRIHV